MPCYDHRDHFTYQDHERQEDEWKKERNRLEYEIEELTKHEVDIRIDGHAAIELIDKLQESTKDIDLLKGGLCAIITELESRGIANDVIAKASREGKIDLVGFWDSHSGCDKSRIAKEIHKYSVHEQNIIKDLLKDL